MALQYGGVCKDCRGHSDCRDKPTKAEPLVMTCIDCDGKGCPTCEKKGVIEITNCPLELVTQDILEVIEMAGFMKKGLPPVAGGVMDQTESFLKACRFIWAEQSWWRNKLGILSDV